MNRKQRRQTKTPIREPVLTMKKSDVEKMRKDAYSQGRRDSIDEALMLMLAIPLKVMHDMYGWGQKKRLPEFAEAITDEYQRFAEGEVTAMEYRDFVYDTCGLMFKLADD